MCKKGMPYKFNKRSDMGRQLILIAVRQTNMPAVYILRQIAHNQLAGIDFSNDARPRQRAAAAISDWRS
jgi:hypothetical protein